MTKSQREESTPNRYAFADSSKPQMSYNPRTFVASINLVHLRRLNVDDQHSFDSRGKAFFKGAPLPSAPPRENRAWRGPRCCAPACGARKGGILLCTQHLARAPRLNAWRSCTYWATSCRRSGAGVSKLRIRFLST